MLKKIGDEITKLADQLGSEKKSREESESAIYEMLRDLINRVKNEIETERKERLFIFFNKKQKGKMIILF